MSREALLKKLEDKRTRCTVWSRVMGYSRPISSYNEGKIAEHKERVLFEEKLSK